MVAQPVSVQLSFHNAPPSPAIQSSLSPTTQPRYPDQSAVHGKAGSLLLSGKQFFAPGVRRGKDALSFPYRRMPVRRIPMARWKGISIYLLAAAIRQGPLTTTAHLSPRSAPAKPGAPYGPADSRCQCCPWWQVQCPLTSFKPLILLAERCTI